MYGACKSLGNIVQSSYIGRPDMGGIELGWHCIASSSLW